ncbi:MAG: GNAT family N-acetyltransferase [Pseudomonadota bacterium]|jgi:GNAT superfamily N-acetyltransferase
MDPAIVLREATRADIDALVEFNAAMAWETEHKRLDPAVLRSGVEAVFDDVRRGIYLVAGHAGAVVAGLLVTYEWSDWRCGDWWWVQSVYVRPEARGRGVFRALYGAIEARARTAGAVGLRLYVERDNARARRTYAALGMQETAYRMYEHPFAVPAADRR